MNDAQEMCFDPELDAWIVTRHVDVLAMLRDPRVVVPGTAHQARVAGNSVAPSLSPHDMLRDDALQALAPAMLDQWREALLKEAHAHVRALVSDVPTDLVRDYAAPWSLKLATRATGVPFAVADEAASLARIVFLGAAHATGAHPTREVQDATASLSRLLHSGNVPTGARADVQTFVALSQTLPGVLGVCWLALLEHPAEMALLRAHPELLVQAVHELLRYASPSRAVFREAAVSFDVESAHVQAGDRLILRLGAANHDAGHFEDPARLNVRRLASGQLALGGGPHRCAGSTLVRLALRLATEALVARPEVLQLNGDAHWLDGYAIRVVESLPAMFVNHCQTSV